MDDAALLRVSRRERVLYEELRASYRALATLLADGETALDVSGVAAEHERADAATAELRRIAATLAPRRLGGGAIGADVRDEWRASAALAAEAAEANARLQAQARARQVALGTRLAQLGETRRVLRGYRPLGGAGSVTLDRA